jgi:hypothetical protein
MAGALALSRRPAISKTPRTTKPAASTFAVWDT